MIGGVFPLRAAKSDPKVPRPAQVENKLPKALSRLKKRGAIPKRTAR